MRFGRWDEIAVAPNPADPAMDALTVWDRYPLTHAVRIAERSLAAELASAQGDHAAAIRALREAVAIEDAIPYDEPPGWHAPVRHSLGVVLLAAGRPGEAEAVYREELRRNPGNGWSLFGLAQSLRAQRSQDDVADVERQLAQAWRYADVRLTASRF